MIYNYILHETFTKGVSHAKKQSIKFLCSLNSSCTKVNVAFLSYSDVGFPAGCFLFGKDFLGGGGCLNKNMVEGLQETL